MAPWYVDLLAQLDVYGFSVVSFHAAVHSAPTGVGSSAGGAEAAAGPEDAGSAADADDVDESVDANTVVASNGSRVSSFILIVVWKAVVM